jgi:hypothetical protein
MRSAGLNISPLFQLHIEPFGRHTRGVPLSSARYSLAPQEYWGATGHQGTERWQRIVVIQTKTLARSG